MTRLGRSNLQEELQQLHSIFDKKEENDTAIVLKGATFELLQNSKVAVLKHTFNYNKR